MNYKIESLVRLFLIINIILNFNLCVYAQTPSSDSYYQLEPLARDGDVDAMLSLGQMFLRGDVIDQDYEMATKYFSKAAEKGSGKGYLELGKLYEQGLGTEVDYGLAIANYSRAQSFGIEGAGNLISEVKKKIIREKSIESKYEQEILNEPTQNPSELSPNSTNARPYYDDQKSDLEDPGRFRQEGDSKHTTSEKYINEIREMNSELISPTRLNDQTKPFKDLKNDETTKAVILIGIVLGLIIFTIYIWYLYTQSESTVIFYNFPDIFLAFIILISASIVTLQNINSYPALIIALVLVFIGGYYGNRKNISKAVLVFPARVICPLGSLLIISSLLDNGTYKNGRKRPPTVFQGMLAISLGAFLYKFLVNGKQTCRKIQNSNQSQF